MDWEYFHDVRSVAGMLSCLFFYALEAEDEAEEEGSTVSYFFRFREIGYCTKWSLFRRVSIVSRN